MMIINTYLVFDCEDKVYFEQLFYLENDIWVYGGKIVTKEYADVLIEKTKEVCQNRLNKL